MTYVVCVRVLVSHPMLKQRVKRMLVVTNTDDYIKGIEDQLNNKEIYRKLPKAGRGSNTAFSARKELKELLEQHITHTGVG